MNLLGYFDEFEKELINYAKSLSRNDWEDLIQHAWVKAMNNKSIFKNMNYYKTRGWFYTVVKNRCFDEKRKSKNLSYILDTTYNFGSWDNINGNIDKKILLQVLDTLESTDRDIVFMRYFQEKNSKEIGGILGINPSSVRYRLKKSLSVIKTKIERSDYYE